MNVTIRKQSGSPHDTWVVEHSLGSGEKECATFCGPTSEDRAIAHLRIVSREQHVSQAASVSSLSATARSRDHWLKSLPQNATALPADTTLDTTLGADGPTMREVLDGMQGFPLTMAAGNATPAKSMSYTLGPDGKLQQGRPIPPEESVTTKVE